MSTFNDPACILTMAHLTLDLYFFYEYYGALELHRICIPQHRLLSSFSP